MIDTVRFSIGPTDWSKEILPAGWVEDAASKMRTICGDYEASGSRLCKHEPSGLRVGGSAEAAEWLEVSLPRLVYLHNGILLRPEDLPTAYAELKKLLTIAAPAASLKRLLRLDLVCQFAADIREWIPMLRNVQHPRVRRKAKEWFDSGLTWPGQYHHVNLYDKNLEKFKTPGNVARLEFQLKGRAIPEGLWTSEGFDFHACYGHYRKLCMGFAPVPLPAPSNLIEFLAWLDRSGCVVDGMRPVERFLASKSRAQQFKLRRALRSASYEVKRIDWAELLPASSFPAWVDCKAEGETSAVVLGEQEEVLPDWASLLGLGELEA